jgi:hypothetical protein
LRCRPPPFRAGPYEFTLEHGGHVAGLADAKWIARWNVKAIAFGGGEGQRLQLGCTAMFIAQPPRAWLAKWGSF